MYANAAAVRARFPHAHVLDYTIKYANVGNAGDFEPGDMTPEVAVSWVTLRHQAGVAAPTCYAGVGTYMPAVAAALAGAFPRNSYKLQTAHYTYSPHRCTHACNPRLPGDFVADSTQYADRGPQGQNVDLTIYAHDYFGGLADVATSYTPPAGQPLSANGTNQMLGGQVLMPGQSLFWGGVTWVLANQADGNVVIYDQAGKVHWQTGTVGKAGVFIMQTDGNLVHYCNGVPVWSSGTQGHPGAKAVFQPADGNFVVYDTDGRALWSSAT
jgi:hypothetical protein